MLDTGNINTIATTLNSDKVWQEFITIGFYIDR